MVSEFQDTVEKLYKSENYKDFQKKYKEYYIVHGFVQLNKDFSEKSNWQIGFYSKQKDNLAIFDSNPFKLIDFEEAFKEDGTIAELKKFETFLKTQQILDLLKTHLSTKYMSQIPTSFLIIVQIIDKLPVYNVTTITEAFSMINTRFDAKTGKIILDEIRSILDLRNGN